MPSSYNYQEPAWVGAFLAADRARTLSTKQRNDITGMRSAVKLSPKELEEIIGQELSLQNRTELINAFTDARDPEIISILGDELTKLKELRASIKDKTIEAKQQELPVLGDINDILQAVFKY